MTYTVVPITPQLLAGVWNELWDRGLEEFRRLGLSLDEAFGVCLHCADIAVDSLILLEDERPVLVAGICPDDEGAFTFMQATQDFDKHALTIIRLLRKRLGAYAGPLVLYSTMVHPESEKFYRVIGFTPDGWCGRTPVGAPLYRFERR